MRCAEVHPNLAAFVLDGLEPEEDAEVRRHLASCPRCQAEVRELQMVNRALEAAPPPADPPSHLRAEILSRVRTEEWYPSAEEESSVSGEGTTFTITRSEYLRVALASAAAIVAIVALGAFFGFLREEPAVATIQLVPTPREDVRLEGYWGVAEIRPQHSGNQEIELRLNNFEEPEAGSYYELWFVSGERRISAGSFTSVGRGETRVLLNAPPEARDYPTLLITEEHVDERPASGDEVALKGEVP